MLIAQLTDLHIKKDGKRAYRRVDTLDCLRKAINHINNLKPRPDYLVITGDLGDFGTLDEYEVIKKELLNVHLPILVVPGNHDERYNLREGLKEIVKFDHPEFCNFVEVHQDKVLIGLDSSVIGKSYGYLSPETLFWLESTLKQYQGKPTLLFMHHPPMQVGLSHMDIQNLQNADDLSFVLQKFNYVQGICTGHLHRPITATWNGLPVWVAPSHSHSVTLDLEPNAPSSFSLEPNAIQLIKFDGKSVVSHISYINDSKGPYPFFDEHGNLID